MHEHPDEKAMKEQSQIIFCHLGNLKTYVSKEPRKIKNYHTHSNHKEAGMVMITMDKVDFMTKTVTGKYGDCIIMKLAISYEYITTLNIHATDDRHWKSCSKQLAELREK